MSNLFLGFVVACFTAVCTVKLAILGEANRVIRMAQSAILYAGAAVFGLVADQAAKFFVGHSERITFRIELLPIYSDAKHG
jgi:hypothetical protein